MNLLWIHKDQFRFNIFLGNTEFINDDKISNKMVISGNSRKRPKPFPFLIPIFFYRFRFHIFGNRFRFRLNLNFGKISKTISGIRKILFPFSSLLMISCRQIAIESGLNDMSGVISSPGWEAGSLRTYGTSIREDFSLEN